MQPVRLGIVGCGVISRRHLDALKEFAAGEVIAVTDLVREAAETLAADYSVPTVHDSVDAMLADPQIDGVILAMPVKGRTAIALKAFEAGKHVLLEKPAGMNADEISQMIAAKGDLVVGSCSSRHTYLPSAQKAAEVVASGKLGELRVVRIRAALPAGKPPEKDPPIWRVRRDLNAGGIMSNWGVYDLDYMLGICGWKLQPKAVLGQVWSTAKPYAAYIHPDSNAETHVAAFVRCQGQTVITLERGEFLPVQKEVAWEVEGELGSLRMSILPQEGNQVELTTSDPEEGVKTEVVYKGDEDWSQPHAVPAQDFVEAVRDGRPPKTSLDRAIVISQITDAIYKSAETGQCVAID